LCRAVEVEDDLEEGDVLLLLVVVVVVVEVEVEVEVEVVVLEVDSAEDRIALGIDSTAARGATLGILTYTYSAS
jgi:hypothetical protein